MTKVEILKKIAVKCTSAISVNDVTGETIAEVLDYIEKNFVLEKPETL